MNLPVVLSGSQIMALELVSVRWCDPDEPHCLRVTLRNPEHNDVEFKFKAAKKAVLCGLVKVKPTHGTLTPGSEATVELRLLSLDHPSSPVLSFRDVLPTLASKTLLEPSWIVQHVPLPPRSSHPSPEAKDPAARVLRGSSLRDPNSLPRPSAPQRPGMLDAAQKWLQFQQLLDSLRKYCAKGVPVQRCRGHEGNRNYTRRTMQWVPSTEELPQSIRLFKSGESVAEYEIKIAQITRVTLGGSGSLLSPTEGRLMTLHAQLNATSTLTLRFDFSDDFEGVLALLATETRLQGKIEWGRTRGSGAALNPETQSLQGNPNLSSQWADKIGLSTKKLAAISDSLASAEPGVAWTPLDIVECFNVSLFHALVLMRLLPKHQYEQIISMTSLVRI